MPLLKARRVFELRVLRGKRKEEKLTRKAQEQNGHHLLAAEPLQTYKSRKKIPSAVRFPSHANSVVRPDPGAPGSGRGHPPPRPAPPSHATAERAGAHSPRVPPPRVLSAVRGPRLSPTVSGGGQPKATREALYPACCARLSSRAPAPPPHPRCAGCPLPLDNRAALLPLHPFPIRLPALAPRPPFSAAAWASPPTPAASLGARSAEASVDLASIRRHGEVRRDLRCAIFGGLWDFIRDFVVVCFCRRIESGV
jgi:hypothetical protein